MFIEMIIDTVGGVIFFVVGTVGMIRNPQKKLSFLVLFLIGGWVIYLQLFGPLSKSVERLDEIITINSSEVSKIIIKPTTRAGSLDKSLVTENIYIEDENQIKLLCDALNESEKVMSGYLKRPDKLALFELVMATNDTIAIVISLRGSKAMISVHSDGDYGWNYGDLKCDLIGPILKNSL